MTKRDEEESQLSIQFTFEEIFKQNERRIHYQIHKLGIRDPHREFYSEGLYALWHAYQKYEPDKGPLATYFNFMIRNRLIDKVRKNSRITHNHDIVIQEEKLELNQGNHVGTTKLPVVDPKGIDVVDEPFWQEVKSLLTEKQWTWVKYTIFKQLTTKEIAALEKVTESAVKSWAKEARKKLRKHFHDPNSRLYYSE